MEKTKILLSNALLELLKFKTFNEIKVVEICEKAMIHKTTFYNHFEDKYELLNYIMLKMHNEIKEKTDKNNGLINYYLSIAKCYMQYIKQNPKLFKAIISSDDNNIGLRIFYNIYINDIINEIKNNNIIDIPSNYVANFYVNAVFSLVSEWFINGMIEDEDTILNYIKILISEKKCF